MTGNLALHLRFLPVGLICQPICRLQSVAFGANDLFDRANHRKAGQTGRNAEHVPGRTLYRQRADTGIPYQGRDVFSFSPPRPITV